MIAPEVMRCVHPDCTWGFAEELEPAGRPDLHWQINTLFPYREPPASLGECLAIRVKDRPWFIIIWEPLQTEAPQSAEPWCCYIRSVIFYCAGKPLSADGTGYRQHGATVDCQLMQQDIVAFAGDVFDVGLGKVLWRQGRWWMRHDARRKPKDTHR